MADTKCPHGPLVVTHKFGAFTGTKNAVCAVCVVQESLARNPQAAAILTRKVG